MPRTHGGGLGPTTTADLIVIAAGIAIMITGITLLLLGRRAERETRLSKFAAPLVTVGLFVALLGPGMFPASTKCLTSSGGATLQMLKPSDGERLDSQEVSVQVRLVGVKLSDSTSPNDSADEAHLHLILDDKIVSMTPETSQVIEAGPGQHRLEAELVAPDHSSFCKKVSDAVEFSVRTQPG